MKISKLIPMILTSAALCAASANSAPVLVGNSSFAGVNLNDSDLEAVLLGKTVSLNGKRVVIVVAKAGEGQEEFLKSKVGKTESQFNNHWRKLFMTGGGTAPTQVSNENEVKSSVSATDGAIGVLEESAAGDLPILAR